MPSVIWLVVSVALVPPLSGCGGGSTEPPAVDAAEAPIDAPGFATCEGACRTTALTATFGTNTRQLDRAYYGITRADQTLHIEAYLGGDAGCPTESSAPPSYALILGRVPVPTSAAPSTSPGNLLDYEGDLLGGDLGARASAVMLTPVAASVCTSCVGMPAPSDPDGLVALDVSLTFDRGTLRGHLFATHCDSFDVP